MIITTNSVRIRKKSTKVRKRPTLLYFTLILVKDKINDIVAKNN